MIKPEIKSNRSPILRILPALFLSAVSFSATGHDTADMQAPKDSQNILTDTLHISGISPDTMTAQTQNRDQNGLQQSKKPATKYPCVTYDGAISLSVLRIGNTTALGAYEAGTNVEKFYNGTWYQTLGGTIGFNFLLNERLKLNVSLNGGVWHNLQTIKGGYTGDSQLQRRKSGYFRVYGSYLAGDANKPWFSLTAGYFSFNYNADARNLGGYLFRSLPYPAVLYSGGGGDSFLGLRLHSDFIAGFSHDMLVWAEQYYPYGDISAGYVADYAFLRAFHFGAGIVFHRLIPLEPAITNDTLVKYPVAGAEGDSTCYSFSGIKIVARFSFDIKKFFVIRFLGEEDLKLYAEFAVLGVKNYPLKRDAPVVGYPDLRERIPFMAGFVLPSFRLLDYIAAEFEYYCSPYKNWRPGDDQPALPGVYTSDKGKIDDIKWSVSAGRRFFKDKIGISVKAASDHLRIRDAFGYMMVEELLTGPDEWYWTVAMDVLF